MLFSNMQIRKIIAATLMAGLLATAALAERPPEETARSFGAILGYGMYCKADNKLLRRFAKDAQIAALAPALDIEKREIKDKARAKELGEHFKAGWEATQHTPPPFGCGEIMKLLQSDPRPK
jgi:hypothetical protein